MISCVLFNVLLVYLLFVYLVVYIIYIVLTLPPGGQPICSSAIIIIIKTKSLAFSALANLPTDRPLLVGEYYCQLLRIESCRVVSAAEPLRSLMSVFYTGAATFSFEQLLIYPHETEWTSFQTDYYSENLVAPGIEPGSLGL
jgi:hypothetical protein